MMNLEKQYLILWLTSEAAGLLLPEADESRIWGVLGQVQGETPGVGLWLKVESVASAPGDIGRAYDTPVTFLIPWHAVRTAQLLGAKPTDRPRAPGFLASP